MYNKTYLCHFGIKGQRWGVRRFQNADGSLNKSGQVRKTKEQKKETRVKVAKVAGGTAVAVGAAYVATKYGGRAIRGSKAARYSAKATTKAHRVTKMRRDMGYYKKYKTGVNITAKFPTSTINRGSSFVQNSGSLTLPLSQFTKSTLGL